MLSSSGSDSGRGIPRFCGKTPSGLCLRDISSLKAGSQSRNFQQSIHGYALVHGNLFDRLYVVLRRRCVVGQIRHPADAGARKRWHSVHVASKTGHERGRNRSNRAGTPNVIHVIKGKRAMLSPVVNQELVAAISDATKSIARDRAHRAELLRGKPGPGQTFGIRRWLRSGFVRSERHVMENGALRSDAAISSQGRRLNIIK